MSHVFNFFHSKFFFSSFFLRIPFMAAAVLSLLVEYSHAPANADTGFVETLGRQRRDSYSPTDKVSTMARPGLMMILFACWRPEAMELQ